MSIPSRQIVSRLLDNPRPADSPTQSPLADDDASDIPWNDIRAASGRVGRQLAALRGEQDQQPAAHREAYSLEHVRRLDMFKPTVPYRKHRANLLCAKTHPQPCQFGCKSCHFCRQRTVQIKTVCSSCEGVNNFYGGPGRGYWCGSCLWLRVGENIDEVLKRTDWLCPCCRDLCNCSSANCMRIKRGWFPTNQLSHEAKEQGFRSVAHYLVLTHVSSTAAAAPIADNSRAPVRAMVPQRLDASDAITVQEHHVKVARPRKRQRTLDFRGHATRE